MEKNTHTTGWTGRADYDERRQERIDRLYQKAGAEEYAARREHQRAHDLVADIPFGQPNIAGHPALPRLREKSIAAMERGIEHDRKADYYEQCAEAAENNTAIPSDDPAALEKLKAKLEAMEARQTLMKAVNAYYRKHKTLDGCPGLTSGVQVEIEKAWARGWYVGIPFPPYELSNNGNMKRIRERIADLERRAASPAPEGWTFDGGEVVANVDENRLQVFFDAIPDEETRAALKSNGFRWARSVGAFRGRVATATDRQCLVCRKADSGVATSRVKKAVSLIWGGGFSYHVSRRVSADVFSSASSAFSFVSK